MNQIIVERRRQIFPTLNDLQLQRIASFGARRHVVAGEVLFEQGAAELGTHVVLSGALELIRPSVFGDQVINVLHAGEFTGEVNVLARRRSLVAARMSEAGDVLVIDRALAE